MNTHRKLNVGVLLAVVWFVGQLGCPLFAQQTGGVPALEERMAALGAAVTALKGVKVSSYSSYQTSKSPSNVLAKGRTNSALSSDA